MRRGVTLIMSITLVMALSATACSSLPEMSRTGAIHTVSIERDLSPSDLLVNPGDEVRWVNHRKMPVRLEFVGLEKRDLSCEHGATTFMGGIPEAVMIKPNQAVSLCFVKPGAVSYNARMDSALPGGESIAPGVIRVGRAPM
jgi:plastocyanin